MLRLFFVYVHVHVNAYHMYVDMCKNWKSELEALILKWQVTMRDTISVLRTGLSFLGSVVAISPQATYPAS